MYDFNKPKTGHSQQAERILQTKTANTDKKKKINIVINLDDMTNPEEYRNELLFFAKRQGKSVKEYILDLVNADMQKNNIKSI